MMTAEVEPIRAPIRGESVFTSRGGRWIIRLGMIVAVQGWLWPIGSGGMMPVGGDVTQFSMGLMAFLHESLRSWRWPLWNNLWGFGFPGLAESQMGVYYPPHWGYAFLSVESAYTASLVLHFAWGACGAAWMARRFGVSELGSALTGFVWISSGFFLIHLPHYWAYTVGSWMPWAWGLTWQIVRTPQVPKWSVWGLAAVLALQILPGHFQLAFVTEIGVLTLMVLGVIQRPGALNRRGLFAVIGALVAVIPLAAAQLVPTLMLARLAGGQRGFEYLSGFAVSPVHLVSYFTPGLWHRSPLWRPLAWELFHTAPEEYLGYVGLVPLLLAGRAVQKQGRSSVEVRSLLVVGLLSLAFSLGPYFPGFRGLITLPGFSFFRAPARWSLATALVLATLAGFGFDQVRHQGWSRRAVIGFGITALLAVGLVVGGFELALLVSRGTNWPEVVSIFNGALGWLPWANAGEATPFRTIMNEAYRPQDDLRVQIAEARLSWRPFPPGGLILARERGGVYLRELTSSALVLTALVGVGLALARRPQRLAWSLGFLTVVDLIWHGQARPFDLGPIRPLIAQSPILARIAASPRGLRTLDPGQNLFLVAGGNSAQAYRTLTLPDPADWLAIARDLNPMNSKVPEALRALGVDARILDPLEARAVPPDWLGASWKAESTTIRDPALAGWLYGQDFVRVHNLDAYRWVAPRSSATRAWLVDNRSMTAIHSRTTTLLAMMRRAEPLTWRSITPERFEVDWVVGANDPPGWIIVSQTYDPEWTATWVGPANAQRPATLLQGFGGWQAVQVEKLPPGRWVLRLDYQATAAGWGLVGSAIGWTGWFGSFLVIQVRKRPHFQAKAAS